MTKKEKIYRDALVNIAKRGAICWDRNRKCSDSQHVAMEAIKKADPLYFNIIDGLPYNKVRVLRNGSIKIKY